MELTRSSDSVDQLCAAGKRFLDQRKFAEAEWQFTQARDRAPDNPEVYYCIGLLFADLARPADALTAFDRAIALDSAHARAHNNRGAALQQIGRLAEAEAAYRTSLDLAPDQAQPYVNLANVLDQQFQTAEALKVYDLALARAVEPELIDQYRSSLIGKATSRSPDGWVRSTFDNFAPTFEDHLRSLKYLVPATIAEMLAGRTREGQLLLDLGCGTGWLGLSLAEQRLRLIGVDLSERMLSQARGRGYESLHNEEVHAYLSRRDPASFDVVTAADVFIYIGRLTDLFEMVFRVLAPGGLFAFSIEESTSSDFTLQNTGRYAHSRGYISRLAGFRFAIEEERSGPIRTENGKAIAGRVYLLRRV